jgi:hypothetical protein
MSCIINLYDFCDIYDLCRAETMIKNGRDPEKPDEWSKIMLKRPVHHKIFLRFKSCENTFHHYNIH